MAASDKVRQAAWCVTHPASCGREVAGKAAEEIAKHPEVRMRVVQPAREAVGRAEEAVNRARNETRERVDTTRAVARDTLNKGRAAYRETVGEYKEAARIAASPVTTPARNVVEAVDKTPRGHAIVQAVRHPVAAKNALVKWRRDVRVAEGRPDRTLEMRLAYSNARRRLLGENAPGNVALGYRTMRESNPEIVHPSYNPFSRSAIPTASAGASIAGAVGGAGMVGVASSSPVPPASSNQFNPFASRQPVMEIRSPGEVTPKYEVHQTAPVMTQALRTPRKPRQPKAKKAPKARKPRAAKAPKAKPSRTRRSSPVPSMGKVGTNSGRRADRGISQFDKEFLHRAGL